MVWRLLAALTLLAALPAAAAGPLAAAPHTVVCYRDIDSLGGRSPGDAIVLQVGPCGAGGTNVGDLRFTATAGYAAGTLVQGVDGDYSRATAPTSMAGYGFVDRDGTQRFTPGDEIILHFGPLPGPVAVGDLDITGDDAFTVITGTSPWMGNQLLAGPAVGDEMYSELDGQAGFSLGDALMLDMHGDGYATTGDLYLNTVEVPDGSQPATTAAGPGPGDGPDDGLQERVSATRPPTDAATSTASAGGGNGAPGPGVALVGLVLAAAVAVARRR